MPAHLYLVDPITTDDKDVKGYDICDASQQKVPYVGYAYLELLSKIDCKI